MRAFYARKLYLGSPIMFHDNFQNLNRVESPISTVGILLTDFGLLPKTIHSIHFYKSITIQFPIQLFWCQILDTIAKNSLFWALIHHYDFMKITIFLVFTQNCSNTVNTLNHQEYLEYVWFVVSSVCGTSFGKRRLKIMGKSDGNWLRWVLCDINSCCGSSMKRMQNHSIF